jgi:Asp-tRNA(Asn)/Glu-tRNA(Gln) amidotransferase A subunit family amidase
MQRLRWDADSAFSSVDLLVTPTTAITPIAIESGHLDPPLPADGIPVEFRNTHMFDVLGLPAISVPCGFTRDGMPIGLQITGPRFSESARARAGACLPANHRLARARSTPSVNRPFPGCAVRADGRG